MASASFIGSAAALHGAAFGGVDDFRFALAEIALELEEVGEEAFFGVHGAALEIGDFAENLAVADDVFPLFHFHGAKAAELGTPDVFVAGAGHVAEAVAEAQVLADEDDGIAAEMLGEIEGEVGDGCAAGEGCLGEFQFAEEGFGEIVADEIDRASHHFEDRAEWPWVRRPIRCGCSVGDARRNGCRFRDNRAR